MNIVLDGKYQTRNGCEVRIYAVDGSEDEGIVHGAYKDQGEWKICWWDVSGKCEYYKTEHDLIEVPPTPKRHEGWVNIYRRGVSESVSGLRPTKELADLHATNDMDRIACLHLQFAEGEGL